MEDFHYLQMTADYMNNSSSGSLFGANYSLYVIKWEGFNDDFDKRELQGENAGEIYKDKMEAELSEDWGENQKKKGISSWSTASEGRYNMNVRLKHKDDKKQIQRYGIKFEVKYED